MKKILSLVLLSSLIIITTGCSNTKTDVVYQEDINKFSELNTVNKTDYKEAHEDFGIEEKFDESGTRLSGFSESEQVYSLSTNETTNFLKNGTGVLLITSNNNEQTKKIIGMLSADVNGGGYPLNYYELGKDEKEDKKVLEAFNGTIDKLEDPILVYLKSGEKVSIRTSKDFNENFFETIKEDIYKTY